MYTFRAVLISVRCVFNRERKNVRETWRIIIIVTRNGFQHDMFVLRVFRNQISSKSIVYTPLPGGRGRFILITSEPNVDTVLMICRFQYSFVAKRVLRRRRAHMFIIIKH